MNPFLKSTDADLKKLLTSISTIHKNVLYLTYQVDFIRKRVMALETDKGLQKQVDDYYEQGQPESPPKEPEAEYV